MRKTIKAVRNNISVDVLLRTNLVESTREHKRRDRRTPTSNVHAPRPSDRIPRLHRRRGENCLPLQPGWHRMRRQAAYRKPFSSRGAFARQARLDRSTGLSLLPSMPTQHQIGGRGTIGCNAATGKPFFQCEIDHAGRLIQSVMWIWSCIENTPTLRLNHSPYAVPAIPST